MFASLAERQVFLVHDVNFHRSVAAGVRQSDRCGARGNGVGDVLRTSRADSRPCGRERHEGRGRGAPPHLPGHQVARRRQARLQHERAPDRSERAPGAGNRKPNPRRCTSSNGDAPGATPCSNPTGATESGTQINKYKVLQGSTILGFCQVRRRRSSNPENLCRT